MMKQAWRSYIASLHPRNIKKLREKNAFWGVYLFVIGLNSVVALLPGHTTQDWLGLFFLRLIPLFFMTWSDLGSTYLMPKPMFLCPMKEEERKEYIRCVLIFKIGGPVVIGFVMELIWSIFFGFHVWNLLIMLFLYFSVAVAQYIGYEHPLEKREKVPLTVYDADGNNIYPWLGNVTIMAVMIMIAMLAAFDANPDMHENTVILFTYMIIVGLLILVVLDIGIVKDQFPYIMGRIGDYERNFKIEVKKTAPQKYEMFAK